MTTFHYQRVTLTFRSTGKCPVCGKRVARSRTFEKTVNPFHKNADGTVKTASEVYAAVKAEGEAWQPDFTHEACLGGAA